MSASACLLLAAVTLSAVPAVRGQSEDSLPTKVGRQVDALAKAYRQADDPDTYRAARALLESSGPDQTTAVERRLAAAGVNVSLADAVVQSRRRLLAAERADREKPPGPVESRLLLRRWGNAAAQTQARLDEALVVGVQLNMPHEVIDLKLPETLAQRSLAVETVRLYEDLDAVLASARKAGHDLSGVPELAARKDFAAERDRIAAQADMLLERIVRLALLQLPDMVAVLNDRRSPFDGKLAAMRRIERNVRLLRGIEDEYRKRDRKSPDMPAPAELRQRLDQVERQYRTIQPRVRALIFHLEQAIHWWKRGHYGIGQTHGGLAKVVPQRGPGRGGAAAAAPLWLTVEPFRPADPGALPEEGFLAAYPPPYRHLWAWRFLDDGGGPPLDVGERAFALSVADADQPPPGGGSRRLADMEYVAPLVGWHEFNRALDHLELLVAEATPDELAGLDDAVRTDASLAVHSNLSRRYAGADALDTVLSLDPPPTTVADAVGPYERRGLAWLMASARLEVALLAVLDEARRYGFVEATTATAGAGPGRRVDRGITDERSSRILQRKPRANWPLRLRPPTGFDRDEFRELLADSLRLHYASYWLIRPRTPQQLAATLLRRVDGFVRASPETAAAMLDRGRNTGSAILLTPTESHARYTIELIVGYLDLMGDSLTGAQQAALSRWLARLERDRLGGVQVINRTP